MTLRDEFVAVLRGPSRLRFLFDLEYEFAMMERTIYRSSRKAADPVPLMAYCNELRIVIHNQLRSDVLQESGGYPDESLEEVLAGKSERVGMGDVWTDVVTRVLERIA